MMEKRWCKRFPVSMKVEILHNGNKMTKCKVKDISLLGMRLETGPLSFYKNTELMIRFPDIKQKPGKIDGVNAIVVRNTDHDIGLMFTPTEPELLNSIIKAEAIPDQNMVSRTTSAKRLLR